MEWLCRHGAVGKFDGSSSPLSIENWSSTNESVKSPLASINPGETDEAHLIAVQKSSSWFGWLPKRDNGTSVVKTHFSSTGSKKSKRVSKGAIAVTPSAGGSIDSLEAPQTPKKGQHDTNKLSTPAKNMARALFASMGLTPEKAPYGNLNSLNPQVRGAADIEMKTTETHINDCRVRKSVKSTHLGTVPGACGLLNIGNTCFMSVGLQCLSHTPLFRSYFLSGRYLDEINRDNPLGTGGKLISEFAQLLKLIWSGTNVHISPMKFKKVLEKCKPIFAGHDQQDAQEFLSEMLDSLHEDVNRVIVKPYVRAPEDHIWDKLTLNQQAEDAWQRHLQRNRSVLVDLFQGQLMSEVTCQSCKKNSRTFDPFMLLSVPLPKHSEKQISMLSGRCHIFQGNRFQLMEEVIMILRLSLNVSGPGCHDH